MEKEKVRSLEKMPIKNKMAYCKLLSLMVKLDDPINQLKLMELYRLMANVRIPSSQRQEIIGFILEGQEEIEELCSSMMEDVNQQERNILRFSLIKDLMIIKGVGSIRSAEEKEVLKKIELLLDISQEQKSFLVEEYNRDKEFYKQEKKEKLYNRIQKETVAKALALGIPISVVFFNDYYRGMGQLEVFSILDSFRYKKRNKRISKVTGLGISLIAAFSIYHLAKWIWDYVKRNELELKELIKEHMTMIHQRAIKYLEKDAQVFYELDQKEINQLLNNTLDHMKKARPRII